MDPTGTHIIVSMTSGANNWYCHKTWRKVYLLKELKGILIQSIAWDKLNNDPESTKSILIGTNKGSILEVQIQIPECQFAKCKEKKMHKVKKSKNLFFSIFGIFFKYFLDLEKIEI